jgi:hypothetical protein
VRAFENKVQKKMFGPEADRATDFIKLHNDELHNSNDKIK